MSTRILLFGVIVSLPWRVLAEDASVDDGGLMSEMDGGDMMSLPEAGVGMDGGVLSPACSCETAMNRGGMIHLCTGSNDRDTCKQFTCNEAGNVRADTCPDTNVLLCCDMEARRLYSQLYADCTHPSCEIGFRKQCSLFGGTIRLGPCEVPDNPDPETDVGGDESCAVAFGRSSSTQSFLAAWVMGALALATRRRRRARG